MKRKKNRLKGIPKLGDSEHRTKKREGLRAQTCHTHIVQAAGLVVEDGLQFLDVQGAVAVEICGKGKGEERKKRG